MQSAQADAIEAILAYHEKVRSHLRRLREIEADLIRRDEDSLCNASRLAADVIRTLGTEMALHERDEGDSLFPRLTQAVERLDDPDPELTRELAEVQAEHVDARAMWRFLRHWLWTIEVPDGIVSLDRFHEACDAIEQHLLTHMEREERIILPSARRLLSETELSEISREMASRRGGRAG